LAIRELITLRKHFTNDNPELRRALLTQAMALANVKGEIALAQGSKRRMHLLTSCKARSATGFLLTFFVLPNSLPSL
jgi:hypothetical protein